MSGAESRIQGRQKLFAMSIGIERDAAIARSWKIARYQRRAESQTGRPRNTGIRLMIRPGTAPTSRTLAQPIWDAQSPRTGVNSTVRRRGIGGSLWLEPAQTLALPTVYAI